MRRRTFLRTASVGVGTLLAGCIASNESESSSPSTNTADQPISIQTPSKGECEPASQLRPTPDSPRAKQYPTLPESLTASSAKTFATTYERAFQYNSRLPEYESIEVDLKVPKWAISETQHGYAVGIDARVQFDNTKTQTASATPRPSGFFEFTVWYYLTDRFALRGDPKTDELQKEDTPNLTGAETVACDTTDG